MLKALAHAGLVTATRGAAGGYRLARPAGAISVAEVVAAIDGDIGLTQCSVHVDECARTNYCPTRPHWAAINRAVGAGAGGGVARRHDLAVRISLPRRSAALAETART